MSEDNIVIFGYEIQHKLVSEIWSLLNAQPARNLLNSLGINPEASYGDSALNFLTPIVLNAPVRSPAILRRDSPVEQGPFATQAIHSSFFAVTWIASLRSQ